MSSVTSRVLALVVGIDDYPTRPLSGCVNDALAIRQVLLDKLRAADEDVVTLLAPHPGRTDLPKHELATAKQLRSELEALGRRARKDDRVFIYYSGHGGAQLVGGARVRQVESLLPCDYTLPGSQIFDTELNALLTRLVQSAPQLTMILDCCHSAGATRALAPRPQHRTGDPRARFCPLETLSEDAAPAPATTPMGRPASAEWLTVAACSATELAIERDFDGTRHGTFTRGLLQVLEQLSAESLAVTTWRDIWTALTTASAPAQHPRLLGDDARPLSGLAVSLRAGDLLVQKVGDAYEVCGGTVVDITPGTLIDVFDVTHVDGASSERACGTLQVTEADTRRALAKPVGSLTWPALGRFRMQRLGSPVLRFAIRRTSNDDTSELTRLAKKSSAAVEVSEVEADVFLVEDGKEWVLCDECFGLASDGQAELVRFGLEAVTPLLQHASRYRAPLRVAQRCRDLQGQLLLRVRDMTGVQANKVTPLQEIVAEAGTHSIQAGTQFCFELVNRSPHRLHVTLLNMARSGKVQFCDFISLEAGAEERVWRQSKIGQGFSLRGEPGFERIVALATTLPSIDFRHLVLPQSFADVLTNAAQRSALRGTKRDLDDSTDDGDATRGDALLWTSAMAVLRSVPMSQ
jgi:hypothetical protein